MLFGGGPHAENPRCDIVVVLLALGLADIRIVVAAAASISAAVTGIGDVRVGARVTRAVTVNLTVDRTRPAATPAERTFGVEAVVEFAAETATLTLDGDKRYQLDISTGAITRL